MGTSQMQTEGSKAKRLLREAIAAITITLIGAAVLAPAFPFGRSLAGHRDALFSAVAVEHVRRSLVGDVQLLSSPLGWPVPDRLALTDWFGLQGLLSVPLRAMGIDAISGYTMLSVVGLGLSAWILYRMATALLDFGPEGAVVGLFVGFGSVSVAHLGHANLVTHWPGLLGLLLLGLGLHRRRVWMAAVGGGCVGLAVHGGFYVGAHLGVPIIVLLLTAAAFRASSWKTICAGFAGWAAGLMTALPVATVYARAAASWDAEISMSERVHTSLDPLRLILPDGRLWLHGLLGADWPAGTLEPQTDGYAAFALAMLGGVVVLRKRSDLRWVWLAVLGTLCATWLLALGPEIRIGGVSLGSGPALLVEPLAGRMRAPARWLVISQMCLGLFGAAGWKRIWDLGRPGRLAAVLIVPVVLMEKARPEIVPADTFEVPTVYEHVLRGDGPIVDLVGRRCSCYDGARVTAVATHQRPVVGGRFARPSRELDSVNELAGRWPGASAVAYFDALGVDLVIDHRGKRPTPDGWVCDEVDDEHRVCTRSAVSPSW